MPYNEAPLRATVVFVNGLQREFPIDMGVARDTIRRVTETHDRPYGPEVLAQLDDRSVVLELMLRFYSDMAHADLGPIFLQDEEGGWWSIIARNVVAIRMMDPLDKFGRRHSFGFNLPERTPAKPQRPVTSRARPRPAAP